MVPPDRETPGTRASACQNPNWSACLPVSSVELALLGSPAVRPAEHEREARERQGDEPQVAERLLDGVLERQAEDDDRERAERDEPRHERVVVGPLPGGIPARDRQSVPWSPRTARHQAVAIRAMSRRK